MVKRTEDDWEFCKGHVGRASYHTGHANATTYLKWDRRRRQYNQEYSEVHGPNSSVHMAATAQYRLKEQQPKVMHMQHLAAADSHGVVGMDNPMWQQAQQLPEHSTACYDPEALPGVEEGVDAAACGLSLARP